MNNVAIVTGFDMSQMNEFQIDWCGQMIIFFKKFKCIGLNIEDNSA